MRRYTADEKAAAVRAYALDGLQSALAICDATPKTIRRWVREAGYTVKLFGGRPTWPEIDGPAANALVREHGSVSAAARACGMPYTTFWNRCRLGTPLGLCARKIGTR